MQLLIQDAKCKYDVQKKRNQRQKAYLQNEWMTKMNTVTSD